MADYWPANGYDKVLRQMERFQRASWTQRDWAERATKAIDYLESRQWSEADKRAMAAAGRPTLTLNRIRHIYELITGYQRRQRLQVDYLPASSGPSSQAIADLLSKISKVIDLEQRSRFTDASVFGSGLATGRGYIDSRISYERNMLGEITEQALFPFSVYPDPDASTYDTSGWSHVITSRWMGLADLDLHYGEGTAMRVTGNQPALDHPVYSELDMGSEIEPARWFRLRTLMNDNDYEWPFNTSYLDHVDPYRKLIRVLEQQHCVVDKQLFIVDTLTGEKHRVPEFWDRERIGAVLQYGQSRGEQLNVLRMPAKRIRWTVTAADEVLYDEWSPYRTFTIVPYFAYFREGFTKGRVEDWCDPQDEVNKRRSNYTEIVSRTANAALIYDKRIIPPEAEERFEDDLAAPGAQIGLTIDSGAQNIVLPQYIGPPVPPETFRRLEADAVQDMVEISGVTAASLGEDGKVQSGRALVAKQQATLVSYENELDNMRFTKMLQGDKRLELIQDFYTEPRIFRTKGEEDRQMIETAINQRNAAGHIVNDITYGRYLVHVEATPDSPAHRVAQLEEALELREKGVPVPDDVLIGMTGLEHKADIIARVQQILMERGQGTSSAVPGQMAGTGRPAADRPPM